MFVNCFHWHVLCFTLGMLLIRMKKKTKLQCSFIGILQSQTIILCRIATNKIIDYSKKRTECVKYEKEICSDYPNIYHPVQYGWQRMVPSLHCYQNHYRSECVQFRNSKIWSYCHIVKFLYQTVITFFLIILLKIPPFEITCHMYKAC
jgi:hypothetical protein